MKKKFAAALFLSLLLLAALIPSMTMYWRAAPSESVALLSAGSDEGDEGWRFYTDEAGEETPLTRVSGGVYQGLTEPGQTFYYEYTLTQEMDGALLEIDAANRSVAVFLDGALLYTDAPEADNRIGYVVLPMHESGRREPLRLSLPDGYAGKTLTIAQGASVGEKPGYPDDAVACAVTLYATDPAHGQLAASAAQTSAFTTALSTVCLMGIALFLYQAYKGVFDAGLVFLSLFALLWAGDAVTQAPLFSEYPGADMLSRLSVYLNPYLSLLALLLFLLSRMRRLQKPFWAVVALMAVSIPAAWAASAGVAPAWVDGAAMLCRIVCLWAAIVFGALEARAGTPFFRVMTATIAALAALWAILFVLMIASGGAFTPLQGTAALGAIRAAVRQRSPHAVLIVTRVLLLTGSVLAVVITTVRDIVRRGTEMRVLNMQYALAQQSYRDLRERDEQVMMLRHDMRHHLTALAAMLDGGETARAADYVRELVKRDEAIPRYVNTGNYMIDVIVNSRLSDAAHAGVAVEVRSAAAPARLPISDQDLCSLLMNALENACAAAAESEAPHITLDMHMKNGFFCFWCENTCRAAAAPAREEETEKAMPEHGYGLKIIEQVTERCGGLLDIRRENGRFRLRLALPAGDGAQRTS